jgi:hypothetical protein
MSNLPKIKFPQFSTLVPDIIKIIPEPLNTETAPQQNVSKQNTLNYYINSEKNVLVIDDGSIYKEYNLDKITDLSSKSGKSLDKNEAIELANVYLKLNIKTSSKKSVFIQSIRKLIGLPPE